MGKRINKLTVYDTTSQPANVIFERNYIYINELREIIQGKIIEYYKKNEIMYRSGDDEKVELVKIINKSVSDLFKDINELFLLTNGDLGLTKSGIEFLKSVRVRHPDLIKGFRFIT